MALVVFLVHGYHLVEHLGNLQRLARYLVPVLLALRVLPVEVRTQGKCRVEVEGMFAVLHPLDVFRVALVVFLN